MKIGKELKWEDIKIGQSFYFIGCEGFGNKVNNDEFMVVVTDERDWWEVGTNNMNMRLLISERTKISLGVLRSQGIKLGRPNKANYELIKEYSDMGLSLRQIAQETGYHYSTISKILKNKVGN